MAAKALIDYSDDELKAELRTTVDHVNYSATDLWGELGRRSANSQSTRSFLLAIVVGVATVANVVVAIWRG